MFKNLARLARYAAPIALAALVSTIPAGAQKPRVNVVNSTNAPLKLNLTSDTATVDACSNSGAPQVRLTADAVSPSGNPIKYKWTASGGTITGEGQIGRASCRERV